MESTTEELSPVTAPAEPAGALGESGREARLARPPLGLVVVSVVVAVLFAAPSLYLLWQNLGFGSQLWSTLRSDETLVPLWRSLWLGSTVALATAIVGTALAWFTTRTDLPGRRVWRVLAPLPLVFPSFVGAAAFLAAVAPGGLLDELLGFSTAPRLEGFGGAWLVLTLFTYPFVYLPVAARLSSLAPSLEENARLLGRRPLAVFRTVVLPQISSAVWAGALLVFLYTISDFGAVSLMRYGTLTREIFARRLDPESAMPLGLVLAAVALLLVVLERQVARRHPRVEARDRRPLQLNLGWWRWPVLVGVVAVLGLALVAPVAVLAYWAIRGLTSSGSGAVELTTDLGALVAPATNTVWVSVVAALVAVGLVLPVAYLTARYRSRWGGAVNAVVVAGFALPGLVVALALVFWVLRVDVVATLYQSYYLLIFAYVVHFGAQAMRASQVAVSTVPRRLDDAARMLGANRARRFATVDMPLMIPGLAAGGGLVLLSTMKELPATLMLAPPNFETLATRIWNANESNYFAQVGVAGLVLVAVSGVLTWLLVVRRTERVH